MNGGAALTGMEEAGVWDGPSPECDGEKTRSKFMSAAKLGRRPAQRVCVYVCARVVRGTGRSVGRDREREREEGKERAGNARHVSSPSQS